VNILTALAENERVVKNEIDYSERRAIALALLFHLVGDIHQPLHTDSYSRLTIPKAIEAGTKSVFG
jgi:hypothetical protein